MGNIKKINEKVYNNPVDFILSEDHTECGECTENYIFKMRDNEHEFYIGLTTILECLSIAQIEGLVPKLPEQWWSDVNDSMQ